MDAFHGLIKSRRDGRAYDTFPSVVLEAVALAANLHGPQKRKWSSELYIMHPFRVARNMYDITTDRDATVAGICHDLIEDTDVIPSEIESWFGRRVTELVLAVTKDKKLPKEDREAEFFLRFKSLGYLPTLLKLSDRYDNLTHGFSSAPAEFQKKYAANTRSLLDWMNPQVRLIGAVPYAVEAIEDIIRNR